MQRAHAPIHRARQRGAATLAVSLVLLFAMLMTAAYAHRSLLLEQRLSANQYREAQAFEAAQSGIDWAVAQLNQARPVDDRCEQGDSAGSRSFPRALSGLRQRLWLPRTQALGQRLAKPGLAAGVHAHGRVVVVRMPLERVPAVSGHGGR